MFIEYIYKSIEWVKTMAQIKVLYSWGEMGQHGVDYYIASVIKPGTYVKISGSELKPLVDQQNRVHKEFKDKFLDVDLIDEAKDYYLYYNFHPSSGWQTEFEIDGNGNIQPMVKRPTGMVLQAFWSEVKVLEIVE